MSDCVMEPCPRPSVPLRSADCLSVSGRDRIAVDAIDVRAV